MNQAAMRIIEPRPNRIAAVALALLVPILGAGAGAKAQDSILVQSTTSTESSGLFKHMLPKFEEKTGIRVNVVAVGTGQAIRNARNCDGDVLFVHARPQEEKFVADGHGVERFDVMYNDFVVVGPASDPAGLSGAKDAVGAFRRIAQAEAPFASRGDKSGTHAAELALWKAAGVDQAAASGRWYRETGSGMGATLNTAVGMNAYALADRGTWISFKNRGDHAIVVEGDDRLFNQYGIILVSAGKCPHVRAEAGQKFVDWVLSSDGQAAIAEFQIDGEQLFFPNARPQS